MDDFKQHIQRTLLYYEIFQHPLSAKELFTLSSRNTLTKAEFMERLGSLVADGDILLSNGFYQLPSTANLSGLRAGREELAKSRIAIARFMTRIITLFPFVRAVFLSGDLSKGVALPDSDIDYVIVTAPKRLWICRTLLIAFKKIFLFNSKKYFCLNYFLSEDHLQLDDRNYYTASEIAHLKPLYNIQMFLRYMNENIWVKEYFPNYRTFALHENDGHNGPKFVQKIFEVLFNGRWADTLDHDLMVKMKQVWARRYPQFDNATRERAFRCTPTESSAYVGNFSEKILSIYQQKLAHHHL